MASSGGSAIALPQIATPARNAPGSQQLLYFKADGALYSKDSGGAERPATPLPTRLTDFIINSQVSGNLVNPLPSGWYYWTDATSYVDLSNTGGDTSGFLQVITYATSPNYATQIVYSPYNSRQYTRAVVNGTAGAWTEVSKAGHVHDDRYFTKTQDDARFARQDWSPGAEWRAGLNVTGGGTIVFDGSANFRWSSRFIVIGNGRGTHFSTAGYYDINMPGSGATVMGHGGSPNKTVSANGILIEAWESLYCVLPIGGDNASSSGANSFRLVSYTSDFVVPDNWLLLAARNGDGDGNGPLKVTARNVTLVPGSSSTPVNPYQQYSLTTHTHDDRYFTQSQSDARYLSVGTADARYGQLVGSQTYTGGRKEFRNDTSSTAFENAGATVANNTGHALLSFHHPGASAAGLRYNRSTLIFEFINQAGDSLAGLAVSSLLVAGVAPVLTTRRINTGQGLTGGNDLTNNIQIAVDFAQVAQAARGLPAGGTTGMYLRKAGAEDYNTSWAAPVNVTAGQGLSGGGQLYNDVSLAVAFGTTATTVASGNRGEPAGGTTGQVLTKNSATDYDASWQTPATGGGSTALPAYFLFTLTDRSGAGNMGTLTFTASGTETYEVIVSVDINVSWATNTAIAASVTPSLSGLSLASGLTAAHTVVSGGKPTTSSQSGSLKSSHAKTFVVTSTGAGSKSISFAAAGTGADFSAGTVMVRRIA